jgi:hypothetical protein
VRRDLNDALDRLKQQNEALLYALNYGKNRGAADETAVDQVRAGRSGGGRTGRDGMPWVNG